MPTGTGDWAWATGARATRNSGGTMVNSGLTDTLAGASEGRRNRSSQALLQGVHGFRSGDSSREQLDVQAVRLQEDGVGEQAEAARLGERGRRVVGAAIGERQEPLDGRAHRGG